MRGIFIGSLVVALLIFSTFQIGNGEAAPSAPVEVTLITASCDGEGNVVGLIMVENLTSQKVSTSVPLVLGQHIPPSSGGSSKFVPVPGATTVVPVNLPGDTTFGFNYGPLSTATVDPQANALRVEVDISVNKDLNPEKSESFPPCVRVTPTPTPEFIPTIPVTPTPTPLPVTPTPELLVPTPVPKLPAEALPPTGGQPPEQGGTLLFLATVIGGGLLLTLIGGYFAWRRPP